MTSVLIRLDADDLVGRGHLARCLPLARALRDMGARVSVAMRSTSPFLRDFHGVDVQLLLDLAWPSQMLEEEAARHEVVVVDIHNVAPEVIERLRRHAPVVGLSAVGPGIAHLDLLINPVARAALDEVGRASLDRPRIRSGPDAVIVDHSRFSSVRGAERRSSAVLVALGGGQGHTDDLREIVNGLANHTEVQDATVCARDSIRTRLPHVDVISAPENFPWLLATTSVVLCGMGTTLFEAAALGTPAVVLPSSPTHDFHAKSLRGYDFFRLAEGGPVDAVRECVQVMTDEEQASVMSEAGRKFARPGTLVSIAEEILTLAGAF